MSATVDTEEDPGGASLPGALARGAAAGLAGALVMTAAQAAEMRVTGRKASMVPAKVGMKLLRVHPRRRGPGRERLNWAVHFGHGVAMGTVRGAMGAAGARGPAGGAAYFAALWGGDVMLYQALGIAGPPWRWSVSELATDVGHKAIYAATTSAVYEALDPR